MWVLTSNHGKYYCHRINALFLLFFFNDTATTEIYTLSLHDALPISLELREHRFGLDALGNRRDAEGPADLDDRSEEHTSELQSQSNLVCRLLLEKKKHSSVSIVFRLI